MALYEETRQAFRALAATPLVSCLAVLSLALGIGANTAIFTLTRALFLKNMPVVDPDRLVTVASDFSIAHGYRNGAGWNYQMWERFRQHAGAFDGAFAWRFADLNLASEGEVDTAHGMIASSEFFTTLGVRAAAGRVFTSADDRRGGGPDGNVVVITHAMWQRRFAGRDVIGTSLDIAGSPYTIVGVTPPGFEGIEVGESLDLVVPLGAETSLTDNPSALLLTVMLRLKPGQSIDSATRLARAIQPLVVDAASRLPGFAKEPYVLVPAGNGSTDKTQLRQRYGEPLQVIGAVVCLVLIIACANVANLLLARAEVRRHELSVRLALGASPGRLVRQLMMESLLLASAGALLGLLVAALCLPLLISQISTPGGQVFLKLPLDGTVLGFTAAVTVATAMLFGTGPALRASRVPPADALRDRGRSIAAGRRTGMSSGLVIVQVAISVTLVFAAGLFLGTLARLVRVPLGFDADGVLVASVDMSRAQPTSRARILAVLKETPGVTQAAASLATPGPGGGSNQMMDARGRAVTFNRGVVMNGVTPDWFSTYGITLRAGRDIGPEDTADSAPVAIVNDAFARQLFAGGSPLGQTFEDSAAPGGHRAIVGVVGDVVLGSRRDDVPATAYVPLTQSAGLTPPGRATLQLSVRSSGHAMADLRRDIASAIARVDPAVTFRFRVVGDAVRASLAQERVTAMLAVFFAVLAALISGLGLYGVTASAVNHRRSEIGVRRALGAATRDIARLVLSQVLRLVLAGAGLGLILSLWCSRWVAALLFDLGPRDPLTLAATAAVVMAVAVAAAWVPTRRAIRVNPATLLRCP
jgi:predicted permease